MVKRKSRPQTVRAVKTVVGKLSRGSGVRTSLGVNTATDEWIVRYKTPLNDVAQLICLNRK
jgi:hypothetical protein